MTIADDHLAAIEPRHDDRGRAEAAVRDRQARLPASAREALALSDALQPINAIAIKLGGGPPGSDALQDATWAAMVALARRDVLSQRAAGTDVGLAAGNLELLERIDALIGARSGDEWSELVRGRVQDLVDARRRGAERGRKGREGRQDSAPECAVALGWLLRHPRDHWLRWALALVSDPPCRTLLGAQIDRLAPSYEQLCGLDWTAEEAAADVICEIEILDDHVGRWTSPVTATVIAPITGGATRDDQIMVRLVEDVEAPFNGTLVSFLAGERWLICARALDDGTLLPLDGTRRTATPGP